MKKDLITFCFFLLIAASLSAQEWMRSLSVAQNLARVQNKMVLMVWEETTLYPYPVLIEDDKGRKILVRNLFTDEYISPIIWDYFVPVIVSEDVYDDMYQQIQGKRKQSYVEKFSDDSIKIMDINGYILNSSPSYEMYDNISKLIKKYALHTEYLNNELWNFHQEKDVYSGYFLALKYLDFAILIEENIRSEVLDLAQLYIDDIRFMLEKSKTDEKILIEQRLELLEVQKELIQSKPRIAIRKLKRIEKDGIKEANLSDFSFLMYTANTCLGRAEESMSWKSNISSLNLKKAQRIINLNK